jgi:hypothetical protein
VITPVSLVFIVPRMAPGNGLILLQSHSDDLIPIGFETILEESPGSSSLVLSTRGGSFRIQQQQLDSRKLLLESKKSTVVVKVLPDRLGPTTIGEEGKQKLKMRSSKTHHHHHSRQQCSSSKQRSCK